MHNLIQYGAVVPCAILLRETALELGLSQFEEHIQGPFLLAQDAVRRIGPIIRGRPQHGVLLGQLPGLATPFLYVGDGIVHRNGFRNRGGRKDFFQHFLPLALDVEGQVHAQLGHQHHAAGFAHLGAAVFTLEHAGSVIAYGHTAFHFHAPAAVFQPPGITAEEAQAP